MSPHEHHAADLAAEAAARTAARASDRAERIAADEIESLARVAGDDALAADLAALDAELDALSASLTAHTTNVSNPHNVTPEQLGFLARGLIDGAGASIVAGRNLASVTRASAGTYTVFFTNALANTNYVVHPSAQGLLLEPTVTDKRVGRFTITWETLLAIKTDCTFGIVVTGE